MDKNINLLKQRTAKLSIISNTLLVVLKLVVGFFTGSVSVVSEAAHSAVDLLAAFIAFYAVKQSSQPPDSDHAYGHGKIEDISAVIEALLINLAAVWIIFEAVQKLKVPHIPESLEYGIVVMVISIIVNYFVSKRLYIVAKLTFSNALEADALHLRADIWTSVGVLSGLVLMEITGFYWMDPGVAIIVAMVIFKAGYNMTKKGIQELTDVSLPQDEEDIIKKVFASHPEVINFHRLRTRRAGSFRLLDVHVVLHKNTHLDKAHNICDEIEAELENQLGRCDVVIHLEPGEYQDNSVLLPSK